MFEEKTVWHIAALCIAAGMGLGLLIARMAGWL